MKTVSVIMATYNGEKYLREQLDSIINQTYPIYEIIIQDDCSTDGTVAIVEEYIQKYPNIRLFVNNKNIGFNQNFKTIAMRATGDLIAISDQDDIWFPDKIEKQVKAIANYDICCSKYKYGSSIENSKLSIRPPHNLERLLFYSNVLGHTMLCQRNFIQDESHWIDSIWYDWSLSLHASLGNGILQIDEPLNWHRRHDKEITTQLFSVSQGIQSSSWKPYIFGFKSYRELLKNENRKFLYNYLYHQTNSNHFPLIHQLCSLMIKDDLISLIRLCLLCQKNRSIIYPKEVTGIKGWIRGFFYPLFNAYYINPEFLFKNFTPKKL